MTQCSPEQIESLRYNFSAYVDKLRASPACPKGHLWSENTVFQGNKRRCKSCLRMMDGARKRKHVASQHQVSQVLEGLNHGHTLSQMSSNVRGCRPDYSVRKIVPTSKIWNFMKAHPLLGRLMKAQSKKNALLNRREYYRLMRVMAAPAIMQNNGLDAFEAIQRACAHIWKGERGDVMSLMFVDASEGKLKLSVCAGRADQYLKRHRHRPRVLGDFSLDATIGEDGTTTWLDTKSQDDRLWA